MTPLPKKKRSHARQGKIRGQIKIKIDNFSKCPNCGMPVLPHRVCPSCGMYKGRQVLKPKTKVKKVEKE